MLFQDAREATTYSELEDDTFVCQVRISADYVLGSVALKPDCNDILYPKFCFLYKNKKWILYWLKNLLNIQLKTPRREWA
jgi:hypothetical protein